MMKDIKHLFFTYRNGAVADTLRRYGLPHKVIFGLEIPRIAEIARTFSPSLDLAERLWADSDVRESRLLATYLFPLDEVTPTLALRLAGEVRSQEEADMLAFRILKRIPHPEQILQSLQERASIEAPNSNNTSDNPDSIRMAAQALARHLS